VSVTPRLLVSVRDAAEAEAALAGGADLIDVKEPSRGPLGRADGATIADVLKAVAPRVAVSAALGELRDCPLVRVVQELPCGVAYIKWGLSGLLRRNWSAHLERARWFVQSQSLVVAVAYADWVPAESPRPADVVAFASGRRSSVMLLDTFQKDGSTLLSWLSTDEVAALVESCRAGNVKIALAGSLGPAEIQQLLPLAPDWFAVRGAACEGGRVGRVTADRVRALADLLNRG
jgi:(5-formylfuran-3-yl)methyl phosphate synthase